MFNPKFFFMKTFLAFVIKFFSLKNVSRIIFLFLSGWLFRFILINCYDIDVFHDYFTMCANLYYLLMTTLSVLTLETFSRLPSLSDIFKCVKVLIKYCQKDKMMVSGPSPGSYGDISSTGRKNVCSMNDANSDNSDNGDSGKSTPCSFTEYSDANLSEMENLNKKIKFLQDRIEQHDCLIRRLNEPRVRALFDKTDRDPNSLTSWERMSRRWIEAHAMYDLSRFYRIRNILGYNAAVDDQINRLMSSMKRASDRIDMHNQRIQAILAEEQNAETSQSQDNSVNNGDNNNNNN